MTGTPTYLQLRLSGLPGGTYSWQSTHIDTEHIHGEFEVQISTDGGTNFDLLPNGIMADATIGGTPDSEVSGFLANVVVDSIEAFAAGAIYETEFTTDGTNDVVLQFAPYSQVGVHRQLFGINGFVLTASGSSINGDFNNDGSWDCADINALTNAISTNSSDLSYDMNGDGAISIEDLEEANTGWLSVGGANNPTATGGNPFLAGDANLDGVVDVSDFNNWNANKFTTSADYCSGDFNSDGAVDVSDFNQWNANKFTSSSDGATLVPEPGTYVLLLTGLLLMRCRQRRS